jgi:hypothetical protein
MRLPKPSLPPANSSTPKPCPAISHRSRALRPKSKPLHTIGEKSPANRPGFYFVDGEVADASA